VYSIGELKKGDSRSFKLVLYESLRRPYGFLFAFYSNYLFKDFTVDIEHEIKTAIANECELIARTVRAVSLAVCEISSINKWRDLQNWVRRLSRSWEMADPGFS